MGNGNSAYASWLGNGGGSGGSSSEDVFGEEFTGSTSSSITLSSPANAGTLRLYRNGVRMVSSLYSYVGSSVTLTLDVPREVTDVFIADYQTTA